jgi:hypothetical protein
LKIHTLLKINDFYKNQRPYELSNPEADKQFVKDAMKNRFKWDIARTSRMGLEMKRD